MKEVRAKILQALYWLRWLHVRTRDVHGFEKTCSRALKFQKGHRWEELHFSRVALQLITLLLEVCLKSGLNLIWGAEERRVLKMISIPHHTCPVGISSFA